MVEQNALPSQPFTKQLWLSALLNGTSVMTINQTHTLLLTTPDTPHLVASAAYSKGVDLVSGMLKSRMNRHITLSRIQTHDLCCSKADVLPLDH